MPDSILDSSHVIAFPLCPFRCRVALASLVSFLMLQSTLQSRASSSTATTNGVRILARPMFLAQQSRPELSQFVWSYRITITNEGDAPVKLLSRHWLIIDADGTKKVVEGEGVVGQQPELDPQETYEYTSHVPLETSWGTMEGAYTFVDGLGKKFQASIPRFLLVPKAPHPKPRADVPPPEASTPPPQA